MLKRLVSVCFLGVLAATSAQAAEPQKLGDFKDWSAYVYQEANSKVCFMMSKPTSSKGNYKKRGDVYVQVTHRTGKDESRDVVSVTTGYPFKANSDLAVTIDGSKYSLFTKGEMAWASSESVDKKLSTALRKGSKMTAVGRSSRGTETTDTYSLKGTSAAYEAISKACS